jgi:hypothetical protein
VPQFLRLPAVGYRASGALFNPWFVYPIVHHFNGAASEEIAAELTKPSSVCLPQHGLDVFFGHHEIVFAPDDTMPDSHRMIEPLRLYFMYRTCINYNGEYPVLEIPSVDAFPRTNAIVFSLTRRVTVTSPCSDPPDSVSVHHATEQESLPITVDDLLQFLGVVDRTLFYAMAFYLRGQDPLYFLVDYSKAVEVILKSLGGKERALGVLGSFGVSKAASTKFHKICNDDRVAPLDIGRHAPQPGVTLRSVDPRGILVGAQRQVFEDSASFCRSVIDGYVQWKLSQRTQGRLTTA